MFIFFFKQKAAYEMRISDWSSDVCSSDLRGYGYQRLGPFDPNGDPVGGRSINEFALEARYRFGNFGIVPFVDAGNAYASTFPTGADLRFGAGIGARYPTNFGDRKRTRLDSSLYCASRMPSFACQQLIHN